MEQLTTIEIVTIIGVISPIIISFIKRAYGTAYTFGKMVFSIRDVAVIVPAVLSVGFAVFQAYAPEELMTEIIKIGSYAYAISQGLYKLQKS